MPDVDGMTLTRWAVEPMIRLKDESNDVFETLALQASSLDCVKWVIRSQGQVDPADRNGETPLMVAAALGDIQTVKYLVAESGRRPSAAACCVGFLGFSQIPTFSAAFWRNPEKNWSNLVKIQQNFGKFCEILGKNRKKFSNF